MSLGRYVCYNGQIKQQEFEHIRVNHESAPAYDRIEENHVYIEWSGWITIPVAKSKLIRALL
jgi:hypothetical protein